MARIITIDNPNEPQQPNFDRTCPGMRSIWPFSWSTYDVRGRASFEDRMRRVYIILTLSARTTLDLLTLFVLLLRFDWVSFVLTLGMDAVSLVFIGWCLSVIAEAQGERRVFGLRVGRWHFDAFLFISASIHVALLIGVFLVYWTGIWVLVFRSVWMLMWLLYVGVAWVARWEATESVSLV